MVDYVAIGRRIKNYRLACGMIQAELAEKLGVQPAQISAIERGRSHASLERIFEIAKQLNVPPQSLIADTDVSRENYLFYEISSKLQLLSNAERIFFSEQLDLYINSKTKK